MCYTETLEVISLMLLHRLTKLLLLIFAGRASLMYSSIVDAYDDDLVKFVVAVSCNISLY